MNRRTRRMQARSGGVEWGRVLPQGSYAEIGEGDARDLLMQVFRLVSGKNVVFDDEILFDSTMTLIRHGLLNVWFAIDGNQVRVRCDLPDPMGGLS